MIYIAICDDDEELVEKLKADVCQVLKEIHVIADISIYTQSKMLQYDIEEGKFFDLILSDIEMPNVNGMNLAKYIKKYLPEILIIFITSYLKYAIDAFELSIFRYIPKNMVKTRLRQALVDAVNMVKLQSNEFYKIEMPSRIEKIPYSKIMYIRREGKNSEIIFTNGVTTRVRKSLSQVFKELNSEDFVYIDRGDIVNLAHIMGIREGIVELKNGIRIPASHSRLEEIKIRLSDFWEEQL